MGDFGISRENAGVGNRMSKHLRLGRYVHLQIYTPQITGIWPTVCILMPPSELKVAAKHALCEDSLDLIPETTVRKV